MTGTLDPHRHPTTDTHVDLTVSPFLLRPTNRLFLGFDDATGQRRWTNTLRDGLAIVGPPGYGKTAGIVIPNALSWDGPAVISSTRGDIFQTTAAQRQRLARPGGKVYVYDPFGSEPGVTSMGWSPHAGCADAGVAYRRAAALTSLAAKGLSGETHWRTGAARILRGLFHAAALSGHDLTRVRSWLSRQELDEPVRILRDTLGAAEGWADDLDGINAVADRERSSFYSAAMVAIDATVEPTVLRNSVRDTFDVDHFLTTKSTLYVIGPKHLIESIAPLLIAIVESITDAARELAAHSGGVLADPLLVILDEIANTPIRSLPAIVSEGGGAGITALYATQSLAFLRERYGDNTAAAILAATPAKLIQGGASIEQDLRNVSSWAGDWREPSTTAYSGGSRSGWRLTSQGSVELTPRRDTSREHSIGTQYRPILPASAIQQLPPLHGWLFYRSDPPVLVRTPPAALIDGFAAVMNNAETSTP